MAPRSLLAALLVAGLVLLPAAARAADTTPPWASDWGPQGAGVPVTTAITVLWSERMNWTSVRQAFTYANGTHVYTAGNWTFDDATNASTFTPAAALEWGTRYTVKFLQTATDAAGNLLDQDRNGVAGEPCVPPAMGDCLVWSFTTAPPPPDTTPPTVLSTSPATGATAATDTGIDIVFSERMDPASVEASFSYGDSFSLYTVRDGTASWTSTTAQDDTFHFAPRLRLAPGGNVTVNLAGTVAQDVAGNRLDGNGSGMPGSDYAWTFSIARDPAPPRVLASTPANGSADVPVEASIRILFNRSMSRGAVAGALSLGGPGAPALTAANGTASWSGTAFPDDTLVFDPYPNLVTSVNYTFRLSAALAVDRQGIRLDGDGDGAAGGDYLLDFTTEAVDRTPPTVVSTDPAAGATDVVATTPIEVAFSEPMNRTSAEAAFSYTDGSRTWRAQDGAMTWDVAGDAMSFRPAAALDYGTRYVVTVSSLAEDGASNPLNGGSGTSWNFTTASTADVIPPRILWTSPFSGQKNVSRTARISIIFSEAMDKASAQASVGITGGATLTGFEWPNDATLEAATARPMDFRTPYVVFVLTGAKDLAGNSMTQPVQIAFTTEPWRGRVTGRVTDAGGAGVGGARVELGGLIVLADARGNFSFESVEQGTYTLTVTKAGYEAYTASVDIGPDQTALAVVLRVPSSPPDVTLWLAVGSVLFAVVVIAVILHRLRSRPTEHYETWKPAKVEVMEPGLPPRDKA